MLAVAFLAIGLNIDFELGATLRRMYSCGYMLRLPDVRARTDHELVLSNRVFPNRHGKLADHFGGSSLCLGLRAVEVTPGS